VIGRAYSPNEVGKEMNSKFSRKALMYDIIRKILGDTGGYYYDKLDFRL
jgi:hypothetical protein